MRDLAIIFAILSTIFASVSAVLKQTNYAYRTSCILLGLGICLAFSASIFTFI